MSDQRGDSVPHGGELGMLCGAYLQFQMNIIKEKVDFSPFIL